MELSYWRNVMRVAMKNSDECRLNAQEEEAEEWDSVCIAAAVVIRRELVRLKACGERKTGA